MKRLTPLFCALWLAVAAPAQTDTTIVVAPWAQRVQAGLDSLLCDELLQTSQLGLMVWDLTDDSLLYEHGCRQLMRPASTMKLLTAISALDLLGGDYQLNTVLMRTGTISHGTLQGDLYCVGGMDPLFEKADMQAFAENLRRMGVDTIRGRLVADVTLKDTLRLGQGWCWDDPNPELTPLLVERRGGFLDVLAQTLQADSIVLDSVQLLEGRVPSDAVFVHARHHSLQEVLVEMMKESNNLMAEAVFYHVAAFAGHRPATADHARRQEREVMRRAGLIGSSYRVADGSGLSLYNYLSAEALTMLLRYAWFDQRLYDQLLPTLPVASVDGTLKTRMKGTAASGNVQAKTGTLTGVTSLAGYLTAANGHRLCFAIINQGVMRSTKGRALQDKICVLLATEAPSATDEVIDNK